MLEQADQRATAIPSRKYPFSSDQGSQTGLGSTNTQLRDRPGILSAVVFMQKPHNGVEQPVLLPILLLPILLLRYHLLPFRLQGLPCTHSESARPATGFW
ncbi:TPA: hypothetical protein ACH3X1_014287 [Trebouxia sp. C0004]